MSQNNIRIAVMVSGGGTNLQALIDAQKTGTLHSGTIALVLSDKKDAYALTRAKDAGIHPKPQFLPVTIVEDGFLSRENLGRAGKDEAWLKQVLQEHRAEIADTLLLTVDAGNKVVWLGKEYGR